MTHGPQQSMLLAIDPGNTQSGFAMLDGDALHSSGILKNDDMLRWLQVGGFARTVAIEMIASYGMPVGAEVFDTCVWIGRFVQAWQSRTGHLPQLVYRKDVKLHLCGTHKAKDANIRQRLIDIYGAPGTKKNPGKLYGIKSHAWAALAVAVTAAAQAKEAA